FDKALIDQGPNPLGAEGVDIHGAFADKMLNASQYLWRTACRILAIMFGFAFFPLQSSTAFRAGVDVLDGGGAGFSAGGIDCGDLWDDLASLSDKPKIANMQVQPLDFVGIVERRALHGRARQTHWR